MSQKHRYELGGRFGGYWARHVARVAELKRLVRYEFANDPRMSDWAGVLTVYDSGLNTGIAQEVCYLLTGGRVYSKDFWPVACADFSDKFLELAMAGDFSFFLGFLESAGELADRLLKERSTREARG